MSPRVAAPADHRIQIQPSLAIELQIVRNVGAELVRSHARGLHLALRPDRHPRKLDRRIRRQHADDGRGAAHRQALDRLAAQRRDSHRLERMIDTQPLGQRAHRLHRIVLRAVHGVRRADALRHLQLGIELVHRDDLPRAADARALHDRQPDAAAAEHRDGLSRLQSRAAQRRADAGQHAASHQCGAIQRNLRLDAHQRVLVQQHVFGIAADRGKGAERFSLLRHARRRVLGTRDDAAGADVRMAAQTLRTGAAEAGQAGDHVIADPHRRDIGTHRLDDAGAFVAKHERTIQREAPIAVHDVQVAVTHAGGDGAHQHLAAPRLVDLHLLDGQRCVHLAEDGGGHFHGGPY